MCKKINKKKVSTHLQKASERRGSHNPATWMLEVTSAGQEEALGVSFSDIYKNSELYRRNEFLIKELSTPTPNSRDLHFSTQYSQSFFNQCIACLWKQHWSYWRNPSYSAVRLLYTAMMALVFGTIFWGLGSKRNNQQDVLNAMGSMYSAVLFIGIQNASSVQPVVGIERIIFYRERAAGMYSAFPYALGQIIIELPYTLFQTIIYGLIVYTMIGLVEMYILLQSHQSSRIFMMAHLDQKPPKAIKKKRKRKCTWHHVQAK